MLGPGLQSCDERQPLCTRHSRAVQSILESLSTGTVRNPSRLSHFRLQMPTTGVHKLALGQWISPGMCRRIQPYSDQNKLKVSSRIKSEESRSEELSLQCLGSALKLSGSTHPCYLKDGWAPKRLVCQHWHWTVGLEEYSRPVVSRQRPDFENLKGSSNQDCLNR